MLGAGLGGAPKLEAKKLSTSSAFALSRQHGSASGTLDLEDWNSPQKITLSLETPTAVPIGQRPIPKNDVHTGIITRVAIEQEYECM
jgi:hypothetical protein